MYKQSTLDDYWWLEESNVNDESEVQNQDDEEVKQMDLQTKFKNLFWSRIVSLQENVSDQFERYEMAPDITESLETIKALEYQGEEEHIFIFEPSKFAKAHGELKLIDYKMSEIQLHTQALQLSKLRQEIVLKANGMNQSEVQPEQEIDSIRSRKGLQHSTKARSSIGISEKERKQLEQTDVMGIRKYKKRHLKMLSINEKQGIIHSHLTEHVSQKDVASQYRISIPLVGRLCSAFKQDPQMLEKLRNKEVQELEMKESITRETTEMLSNSKPIWNVKQLQDIIEKSCNKEIQLPYIKQHLKKELNLSYRKIRKVSIQANSE